MPSNCPRSPARHPEIMVRPRFAKLPERQQQTILQSALTEFAERGFHDASLNRVIDEAGISKGSMYYYFDGKDDLYAYVASTEIEKLFATVGASRILDADDADTFWSVLEDYYHRLMSALLASPQVAAFLRGWAIASRNPAFSRAQEQFEQAAVPWIGQVLASGQRVRAVRDDLPSSLLISLVLSMGEAMDSWLLGRQLDEVELSETIGVFVELVRRAIAPASNR